MEEIPLRVRAGAIDVRPTVAVVVRPCAGHPVRARLRAGLLRDVHEAFSLVAIQVFQAEVVGRHQVLAAVLVVVLEERREGPARLVAEAARIRRVGQTAPAVVQVQEVAAAVLRVERGIRHLTVVVARDGDVKVQVPVGIDVGEGGRARVLGNGDARGGRDLLEASVAQIAKEPGRTESVGGHEIRKSVAVDVARGQPGPRNSGTRGLRQSGRLGDVGEPPRAVARVENRAHSVADEEVLVAVAVEVEHRDARARPDVGDQAIGLRDRRVAPRRSEAGLGRDVTEARRRLDTIEKRFLEPNRMSATRFGHGRRRRPFDPRAVAAQAADGEGHRTGRGLLLVVRPLDAIVDVGDPVEPVPGPIAELRDPIRIRGRRCATPQRPPRRLVRVAPPLEFRHPRPELPAKPLDRRVLVDPPAGHAESDAQQEEKGLAHRRAWYRACRELMESVRKSYSIIAGARRTYGP